MHDAGVRDVNDRAGTTIPDARGTIAGHKRALEICRSVGYPAGHTDTVSAIVNNEGIAHVGMAVNTYVEAIAGHLLDSNLLKAGHVEAGRRRDIDPGGTVRDVRVLNGHVSATLGKGRVDTLSINTILAAMTLMPLEP